MSFRAEYEDLSKLGDYVEEKSEEIDKTLENIKSIIKTIPVAWSGGDSEVFVSKVMDTIQREKKNNLRVKVMSKMLKYASDGYQGKDSEWLDEIKNEVFYNEYRV